MKLSDKQLKALQPKDKPYKLSDGHCLFIHVQPQGSKYWRYKYYWEGRQKSLAFGVYPEISLEEARELRQQARKLKREGKDPAELQRTRKIRANCKPENTFERLATEWLEIRSPAWSRGYLQSITSRLRNDIYPLIGHRSIGTVLPMDIIQIARTAERRECYDVARKSISICGQIFRYGIITGRLLTNPADNLLGAVKTRRTIHRPYFKPAELSQFLYDIEHYQGPEQISIAIKLMLLTFVRTKELCDARSIEFDMDHNLWRIPAERMKVQVPHIVPLSTQTSMIVKGLLTRNHRWEYLLTGTISARDPFNKTAMRNALIRMGYQGKATIHGIRATASTILNESGLFSADAIERQLAHQEINEVRRAYDHSNHLAERVRMMQWWADYLTNAGLKLPKFPGVDHVVGAQEKNQNLTESKAFTIGVH